MHRLLALVVVANIDLWQGASRDVGWFKGLLWLVGSYEISDFPEGPNVGLGPNLLHADEIVGVRDLMGVGLLKVFSNEFLADFCSNEVVSRPFFVFFEFFKAAHIIF